MPNVRPIVSALLAMSVVLPLPAAAQQVDPGALAGWWGYDEDCPASDNGFGLASDGKASDGNGAYAGRWALRAGQVTVTWQATETGREDIDPGKWRITETFNLPAEPGGRVMLENAKTREKAWLCRKY
ncbi:MAG: hypothetical protein OER56_06875 [Hyphomicrobiales bacterium]|nr:hypothetical protein [Hyphomicrobiales bacterium]